MSDDRMPPHSVTVAIEHEADTLVALRHMEYSLARREVLGSADQSARQTVRRLAADYERIRNQTRTTIGDTVKETAA